MIFNVIVFICYNSDNAFYVTSLCHTHISIDIVLHFISKKEKKKKNRKFQIVICCGMFLVYMLDKWIYPVGKHLFKQNGTNNVWHTRIQEATNINPYEHWLYIWLCTCMCIMLDCIICWTYFEYIVSCFFFFFEITPYRFNVLAPKHSIIIIAMKRQTPK